MTAPRIGFLVPRYNAVSTSNIAAAMDLLAEAGVIVDLIHPTTRVFDLSRVVVDNDLYVLKRTNPFALSLAGELHARGAAMVNPYPATVALHDKIVTFSRLQAAGIPTPASYIASHPDHLAPLLDDGPLVVKPYHGSSGFGVRVVRTPAELGEVQVGKDPVFAQRYHSPEGRDRKMYRIGDRVFGVKKVFPARTPAEKHGEPFTPGPELHDLVARCGQVFGIDLYGLDIVESGGRPYVVDLSPIPGFRGVPDAGRLLADHFLAAAQRVVSGAPVLEPAAVS
jgi:ribosomal protein S6--L-glutamate ligase